jgi:hypothetical protein
MSGDRSRERRQRACECLEMAKRASDANIRALFVDMAWKWLDLAELDEWDNWEKALRRSAIQAKIGQELRAKYELPQELPDRILTLLMKINAPQDGESGATAGDGERALVGSRSVNGNAVSA